MIRQLITQKIAITYFGVQFGLGSLLSLLLLSLAEITKLGERLKTALRLSAACLILIGVFAMRWNVVIGGQLISKSLRGFSSYTPELLGEGGILSASALALLPFVILAVMIYFIPPWQEEIKLPERRGLGYSRLSSK